MKKIKKLDEQQLESIKGGAVPYVWIGIAIATFLIFLSGVIDGITNPKECGT